MAPQYAILNISKGGDNMKTSKEYELGKTRQQRITVRFTADEKEKIKQKAKELGMTYTELFLTVLS